MLANDSFVSPKGFAVTTYTWPRVRLLCTYREISEKHFDHPISCISYFKNVRRMSFITPMYDTVIFAVDGKLFFFFFLLLLFLIKT